MKRVAWTIPKSPSVTYAEPEGEAQQAAEPETGKPETTNKVDVGSAEATPS